MNTFTGYRDFCRFISGKSVALIGLGVSNLPLVAYLRDCGAESVVVRELNKGADHPEIIEAKKNGATVILGENYLDGLCEEVILRSPGIRPDIPPFLKAVREYGSYLTCDTELFLRFASQRSLAVTGSDGKTTTTTLTAKILEKAGYEVVLGGNIGSAMLPRLALLEKENAIAVMELSSFQLMNCRYSPKGAVITNLSENHLDWHRDMTEYMEAKKNILCHQRASDRAVLNFDNANTAACRAPGQVFYFSDCAKVPPFDKGYYALDGAIYRKDGSKSEKVMEISEIFIPGRHNVWNYMAAMCLTDGLVPRKAVLEVARCFTGVEHRIELVREKDRVRYFNSSIDSSPARTTAALNAFQDKLIVIAGGYDKHLDYTPLGDVLCRKAKALILCGATAKKIECAVKGSQLYRENEPRICFCERFEDTVKAAANIASPGDTVILSPASASFDMFRNFSERGKTFKKLVNDL